MTAWPIVTGMAAVTLMVRALPLLVPWNSRHPVLERALRADGANFLGHSPL